MKPSSRWTRGTVLAALPAFVAAGVMAGCGAAGAHHGAANHGGANHGSTGGHGKVVAFLPIPYRISSEVDTGVARTVKVMVRPGQRFSVKVATSDGPFWWRQVGPPPDGRVVSVVGDYNAGRCVKAAVGCRVPYFHILQARTAGSTTMTWMYREPSCLPVRKRMTEPGRSCIAAITFDITVR